MFTLTLQIAARDVARLSAEKQKIVLSKPLQGGAPTDVTWLAFDPMAINMISWEEHYWIYASKTDATEPLAQISKLSEVNPGPAMDGCMYGFSNSGAFGQAVQDPDIPAGTYACTNHMSSDRHSALTFGLSQSAVVNQRSFDRMPISATSMAAMQDATLTPGHTVYVWLQSEVESGTTRPTEHPTHSVAAFGNGVWEIGMTYDAIGHHFVVQAD